MSVRTNLVVDLIIAVGFLVANNPPLGGLAFHEWFGLALGAGLIAHLLLHWEWMASAASRLARGRWRGLSLNAALDAILFVALTAAVLSGLLCSKHVVAALGLPLVPSRGWRGIHSLAADLSVVAMGVHLGLHWNWIALNLPRLFKRRAPQAAGRAAQQGEPSAAGA